jgi:hypothetical protein
MVRDDGRGDGYYVRRHTISRLSRGRVVRPRPGCGLGHRNLLPPYRDYPPRDATHH